MAVPKPITGGDLDSLRDRIGLKTEFKTLGDVISALLLYIFPIAGLLLLVYLLYGGYRYMLSRGDPKALQEAKGVITTALIGFLIVFVSFWVVQIIGVMFGISQITDVF